MSIIPVIVRFIYFFKLKMVTKQTIGARGAPYWPRFDYEKLRFLTVGMSNKSRLLAVAWFEIGDDSLTIITAFKPSKKQIKGYNNG